MKEEQEKNGTDDLQPSGDQEAVQTKAELDQEDLEKEDSEAEEIESPNEENEAKEEPKQVEFTDNVPEEEPVIEAKEKEDESVNKESEVVPEDVSSSSEEKKTKEEPKQDESADDAPESEPVVEAKEKAEEPSNAESEEGDSDEEEADDDHQDEEQKLLESLELEGASKQELYDDLKKFSSIENMRIVDKALKEIRPHYDKIYEKEEQEALAAFKKEEGNDEGSFEYKADEIDQKFFYLYNQLRDKKQAYFSQLNRAKEDNLQKRNELLERLREIVDGEESTTSLNALKSIQEEWKKIGPVHGQYAKSLWANYNALLDRFYDNRSIYFELKELDRKKNLEAKLELCERAEGLDAVENIKEAIFELNELHEEFKHIGPVPKEDQEPLWQRFKAASDNIYAKRKDYFDHLKKDLQENMDKKVALGEEAKAFTSFESDKITEWNKKTKEILELQKRWDAIGGLPREKARDVNKNFWGNFKKFFRNKNEFFRSLEGQREENLKKKQELLEKAEALKDSDDWNKAANELKSLQTSWRDIGPVPEKFRNEVYKKFKAACDHFFDRKRAKGQEHNKEFEDNLRRKEDICSMLEAYMNSDTIDLEQVYDLMDQYAEIGFVPRNAIKKIHDRYDKITNDLVSLEELSEDQKAEMKMQIQVSKLKNSPHGNQKINRKENAIKRKISTIENDISTWKTNMEFFADSKNADQLKGDFQEKIDKALEELEDLKKQLGVLNQA